LTFPVYFNIAGHRVHPHLAMELIAYSAGFQLYLLLRRRDWPPASTPALPFEKSMWIIVGAVFGALAGSKLLAFVESFDQYRPHLADARVWLGGKTIVGGLLGGWAGVEVAKKCLRVTQSTGDAFVFPLILGMCVGRVGCFLTGLDDHTHGVHSTLPWAVDFGDGPRHPTQLYEVVFLLLFGIALAMHMHARRTRDPNGTIFRLFMLSYLAFRFMIEFLKPRFAPYLGLSAIQLCSLAGGAVSAWQLHRRREGKAYGARPAEA
jgi:prolipoprotein diacylglyceryltransferase